MNVTRAQVFKAAGVAVAVLTAISVVTGQAADFIRQAVSVLFGAN